MATYDLYEGGSGVSPSANRMLPSGIVPADMVNGAGGKWSYSDHQRERAYGVTRSLDGRAPVPGGRGATSRALNFFLSNLTTPLAISDKLRLHLLIPNTVLMGVSYGNEVAVPGLTFDLDVEKLAVNLFTNASLAAVPVNTVGVPTAAWKSIMPTATSFGQLISNEDYVTMTIKTLPTAPATFQGLNMWVTAHVFDLNHGNNS